MRIDNHYSYNNADIFRLLHGIQLPEFVKQAGEDELDLQKASNFAVPSLKEYPIDTPARTLISAALLEGNKQHILSKYGESHYKNINETVKTAAEVFKIKADVEAVEKAISEKVAKDYDAIVIEGVDIGGHREPVYVVKTANDIEYCSNDFVRNIANFDFNSRRVIASAIVKAAQQIGVDEIPDLVCKYAGMFMPDIVDVRDQISFRSHRLPEKVSETYRNDMLKQANEASTTEDFFKLAETMNTVEFESGAMRNPRVARDLSDPVDVIFSLSPEKVAEYLDGYVTMGEKTYKITDLQKVSADKYKEAFGVDIDPSKTAELQDILPTMPLSDVSLFTEISGIKPV